MITAAPDTTLQDGREVCVIRARELEPGDVIQALGAMDLIVESVSMHALKAGFVVVHYRVGSEITGERAKTAEAFVCIKPRTESEGSVH
jgi:hypothetical protein